MTRPCLTEEVSRDRFLPNDSIKWTNCRCPILNPNPLASRLGFTQSEYALLAL